MPQPPVYKEVASHITCKTKEPTKGREHTHPV